MQTAVLAVVLGCLTFNNTSTSTSTIGGRGRRKWKRLLIVVPLLVFADLGIGQDWPTQVPQGAALTDPIAELQKQIDLGQVRLDFDAPRGYLDSLLGVLDIPAASQTLVFSKTSLQSSLISPDSPRAIYFNDDVYVGFVRDGPIIEIASTDPRYGTIFYTLEQSADMQPAFDRQGASCINCHLPAVSEVPIPRLMMMSVMPNETGEPVGSSVLLTTDRSHVGARWGGWYVTGTGGEATHLGNMVIDSLEPEWRIGGQPHLNDVRSRFDTSSYLGATSDVVALLLLTHQSEVHNMIGEAAYAVRHLRDGPARSDRAEREALRDAVEPLVRVLLFADVAPFQAPVGGSSEFAREFASRGPRDRQGRSLRELDLNTRLLRHPMSYVVYSNAFDHLPERARDYVYERFRELLAGGDTPEGFPGYSDVERATLMEILLDTKPSFRAWMETH